MIIVGSIFNVTDNSGVKTVLSIGNLSRKTLKLTVGDIIVGVVKRTVSTSKIKRSSIVKSIIVRTKKNIKKKKRRNCILFR